MKLATFFVFQGSTLEKSLKALCLICWSVGGVAYIYGYYEAIMSERLFPGGTQLEAANWCLHIGLRFVALWIPMGFALNQWEMKRIVVAAVYLLGCVLAIVFSLVSLILILPYGFKGEESEHKLRTEYIEKVRSELKEKEFPPSVSKLFSSYKCCGWFGPTDFGPNSMFDISSRIESDKSFMEVCSECYGKTFTVSTRKGSMGVIYRSASNGKPYEGCGEMLVNTANRQITFILIASVIIIILSVLVSALYIFNFKKLPSSQVDIGNDRRNQRGREAASSRDYINEGEEE